MPMLEGYAIGGPRDGIKLTASPFWDGGVTERYTGNGAPVLFEGHYEWSNKHKTWIWSEKPITKSRARVKYAS